MSGKWQPFCLGINVLKDAKISADTSMAKFLSHIYGPALDGLNIWHFNIPFAYFITMRHNNAATWERYFYTPAYIFHGDIDWEVP